ncbi:MAG: acyl-CoA thioesterase [Oligoflexus sp.]
MNATPQTYVYPIQVRFCDTDALGHINNAVYLSYFEASRVDWLNLLQERLPELKSEVLPIILARAEIDFLQQAYLHDRIEVHASIAHIGKTSFQQVYELRSPDRGVLARGRAVLVWFDIKSNQKRDIPPAARSFMEEYFLNERE